MSRGADAVVAALVRAGVSHLFSLSGNQILTLYDATIDHGLSIIHTRHEAAAVHMADAWGRLTERPGVALVTAGPGHLNTMSALYGALMAESPVVLLSGHASLGQLGRGAFQEVDQAAAAAPVTKASWMARSADGLGDDIARALAVAVSGRPGPVHVSLPNDLLDARVATVAPSGTAAVVEAGAPPDAATLGAVLALLERAARPLVLLGPAMARHRRRAAVDRFSALTGIPALPVESPRGVNDPWLHGAVSALAEADVVVLLGKKLDFAVRFGEPPAFARDARFVHIDVDGGSPAGDRVALALVADPVVAIEALTARAGGITWKHRAWGDDVLARRRAVPAEWDALRAASTPRMHPLAVCDALQPYLDAGAVLVNDGGEFGQWTQAGLETERRLINGLAGSIGSAIPMACAAKLFEPARAVLCVVGDGTFGFHAFELDTAARHGLPLVVVVGNDARWNAEHQLQLAQYGAARAIACELRLTRYDLIADALGGHGELVERADQLAPALARAVASGRPACVNVLIDGVAAPTYRRAGPPAH
jgi:thiamine pyrophosphate-dependent acetolactate synthase large subunit-like protein